MNRPASAIDRPASFPAFAAIFVALTLSAYHAPRPHDLPVGIVGPAAVTSRVEHALDSAAPGAFGWRSYPSEIGARTGKLTVQLPVYCVVAARP